MKSYSTAIRNQYYNDKFFAVDMVEIHLRDLAGADQAIYLNTGNFDISYDTDTAPTAGANKYLAQGQFMGYTTVAEEFDLKVGKFNLGLSAIGTDYITKFTTYDIEGRRVCIYKAFLDFNTFQIVDKPIIIFDGIIMNVNITESAKTCNLSVECSTLFSDFERTNGRKTDNGSNWLFQGTQYDRCMEKAGWTGQTEFKWGKE